MIEQVGHFANGLILHAVLGSDDDFGRFFANFFADLVQPLLKKIAGVGFFLRMFAAVADHLIEMFHTLHCQLSSPEMIGLKKQLWLPV